MKAVCILVQNVYDLDPRVRRKAEALIDAGYSVDVLALSPPDGRKTYTLNGVNVRTVSLGKKRGSHARYAFEYGAFFLWALMRVSVQMRRRRYEVIDVNTLPDVLVFAAAAAKWMGAKVVLDMHEITPEFYMSKYGRPDGSWVVRVLKSLERSSFRFADRTITITDPVRELLIGRGVEPGRCTVVMNAADESRFASGWQAAAAVDAPARGKFVMMYHGTLTRIYGVDIAIEAFALSHTRMPDAELWILGSGPEADSLRKLTEARGIGGKVRLIGQVAPLDVPAWLRLADVGVLPIRSDVFLDFAFPNKLPEYIIAGKPVLISHLKTIRHYFSPKAVAFVEPNNAAALAEQMVTLYGDRTLRLRLAARAREEYAPTRWDVMKGRYLGVIADLIDPHGRRAEPACEAQPTVMAR
jgi:glycosyltransferase involved in cell wall biosynthesis